ncbi:hypothetical protein M8542_31415 [Amycolatopsis sp. OK19-0408]|uniref:Uncharacterized protein n=1 Tax=Amycolatopsis iheyensis TaxID=2945988 RepID=A0A9X2NGJ1_9PSEU|nr:hypothetical protein [Amycolatopsis iheyensis]MCR6487348.1 hypothetical protein [Amycolatopsis iheyensis]
MGDGFKVDLSGLASAAGALGTAAEDARKRAGYLHVGRAGIEFTDGCTLDDLLRGATSDLPLRKLETCIAELADIVEKRQKHLTDQLEYAQHALLNIKTLYARADGQEG